MNTFKQFLAEGDPLNDLAIEMWLMNRFGISHAVATRLHSGLTGETDEIFSSDIYGILTADYADDMPYAVAKGRADDSADIWLTNKITYELQGAGLELE